MDCTERKGTLLEVAYMSDVLLHLIILPFLTIQIVEFLPLVRMSRVDMDQLVNTLRVEHLGLYLFQSSNTTHWSI